MPQFMLAVSMTRLQNHCYGNYLYKLVQLVGSMFLLHMIKHFFNKINIFAFSVNVHMPKDRVTQMHQGYGFVEFLSEDDADYAIKIMNMIKLYGKPIRVNKASAHQKNLDVGANIFIGNLDPEVDEKLLYDTFSAFGVILQTPKVRISTVVKYSIRSKTSEIFSLAIDTDHERSRNGQFERIRFYQFC